MDPPEIAFISLAAMGERAQCFKEPRRRDVSKFRAAVAPGAPTGFWRISGHPAAQAILRNHFVDSMGLPHASLFRMRLNPFEPPCYATRMPGDVGGAAP
jgi:hypothetical protein